MNSVMRMMTLVSVNVAAAFALLSPAAAVELDIVDTAAQAGSFSTLLAAADAAGLVDALKSEGPLTVFAPTDEAFAKLPEGTVAELLKPENISKLQAVLKYHVVAGSVMSSQAAKLDSATTLLGQTVTIQPRQGSLAIDDAMVVAADIQTSNGVIHVIDNVLLPGDIVSVAMSAGSFGTLTAALQAAGLVDTLANGGPFTVFAPTDEAFAKLPAGTVAELLKPENKDQLIDILTYHVVPGSWNAADVVSWDKATTANGMPVWINVSADSAAIGGANIVATDIQAFNGVIHVIDTVMIPAQEGQTTNTSWSSNASCEWSAGSSCGH